MMDPATASILVGFGAVILVQAGGMLFWGGRITSDVSTLKKAVEPIANLSTDMARLEERIGALLDRLGDTAQAPAGRGRGRAHADG